MQVEGDFLTLASKPINDQAVDKTIQITSDLTVHHRPKVRMVWPVAIPINVILYKL